MKAIGNKVFKTKGLLHSLNEYLEKEHKDFLFNRKSQQEEKEYFNFFKFLFNSPDEVSV
jgi:hypothetical protein